MNPCKTLVRRWLLQVIVLFFIGGIGISTNSFAQESPRIEIPSSFNPVGSGARSLGMGGAFIAVADDATAASWNPGGLIQLEHPEVSIVGAGFHRSEENEFGTNPEADGTESVSGSRINYLSASYPFTLWKRNMVVSVNYQNLYDMTRKWNFSLSQSEDFIYQNNSIDYDQDGTLSAWGIAYCIQILPTFSLGFTLNIWEDGLYKNDWEQNTVTTGSGNLAGIDYTSESRENITSSFSGINANFGILWNLTSQLTIGAVVKTPFTADVDRQTSFDSSTRFPDFPLFDTSTSTSVSESLDLDMPMSYGIGLAYRFSDNFTASLDAYRTEWEDFELKDSAGNKTSPITGRPSSESDIDPTYQVRMGAEYLFISSKFVVPLRGGVFYDPAPAEGSPDDIYGFTAGTGIGIGRFIFDVAYQFRYGNDIGASILENLDFSQDLKEHSIYASTIVHF